MGIQLEEVFRLFREGVIGEDEALLKIAECKKQVSAKTLLLAPRRRSVTQQNGAIEFPIEGSFELSPAGLDAFLNQVLEPLGAIVRDSITKRAKQRILYKSDGKQPLIDALEGWARSVESELPLLSFESGFVREMAEIPQDGSAVETAPFRQGRTYVITGGAGGIGREVARHLCAEYDARVVLLGRSPENEDIRQLVASLKATNGDALYLAADITDFAALDHALTQARQSFGPITGVLHSAVVLADASAGTKSIAELKRVIAPKILGALHLDAATKNDPLECFVLFSSLVAFFGNSGQSDYAYANSFLHYFGEQRRKLGKPTLVMHWPLWETGQKMPEQQFEFLHKTVGIDPLPVDEGIRCLEWALRRQQSDVVLFHGDTEKIRRYVASNTKQQVVHRDDPTALRNLVAGIIANCLKLPAEQIEPEVPLQYYGVDSVWMMKILDRLSEKFGALPKTLFFERQNLDELTRYLAENHAGRCAELLGSDEPPRASTEAWPGQPQPAREDSQNEPIAIIGIAGRFPDAPDLDVFWQNLREARDSIREIPAERWTEAAYPAADPAKPERRYSKWGGFLEDVDCFDPRFFNITPREARDIDPQVRLFLETAWHTVENAGYSPETLARTVNNEVGVFVGVMWSEYTLHGPYRDPSGELRALTASNSGAANRVSFAFDWHGPSMAVDTMCSSSLTSIHLACESLRTGACRMALAGGVNVSIHPNKYLVLGQNQFTSSDGRCRSFGEGGDGFAPGEGAGAVLLKPLRAAVADGDHIHAVIAGSALNHRGSASGYAVPSPQAQAAVIKKAVAAAGVEPSTITYVESSSTGTSLGDLVEIRGLVDALGERSAPCPIGSVKSNIGHLESASGIASVAKVVLQMRHRELAPSLHAETLNSNIDWAATPFFVQREPASWARPAGEIPRRAMVSSYGAGGSNALLILEEFEAARPFETPGSQIVPLSARDPERLEQVVRRLLAFLRRPDQEAISFADLAFTLQTGRKPLAERLAVVASSIPQLTRRLEAWLQGSDSGIHRGRERRDATAPSDATDLEALAAQWVNGAKVDWWPMHSSPRRRVPLPGYPFARERYWPGTKEDAPETRDFSATIQPEAAFIRDHHVFGQGLAPGMALLELVRAREKRALCDVRWLRPVIVNQAVTLAVRVEGPRFNILSGDSVHATGQLGPATEVPPSVDLDAVRRRCDRKRSGEECYRLFRGLGLEYGPSFQPIRELLANQSEALATLQAPQGVDDFARTCSLHDGALQTTAGLLGFETQGQSLPLPFTLGALRVFSPIPDAAFSYAQRTGPDNFRILILDSAGRVCVALEDFTVKSAAGMAPAVARPSRNIGEIQKAVADALGIELSEVDPGLPLADFEADPLAVRTIAAKLNLSIADLTGAPSLAALATAVAPAPPPPANQTQASQQAGETIARIISQVAELPKAEIDLTLPFVEFGIDSIMAVDIVARIREQTGVPLRATDLFNYSTVERLAVRIGELQSAAPVVSAPVVESEQMGDVFDMLRERPAPVPPPVQPPVSETDIAIIGVSGLFPGAANLDRFWTNLATGQDSVREIPAERFDIGSVYSPDRGRPGSSYSRWAGLLDDVDLFDPLFFNISPREAIQMDPQQRLFLEQSWLALENAGITVAQLDGARCGVFVGAGLADYKDRLEQAGIAPEAFTFMGNASSILAARISFFLNLKGPAVSVDTACSSSLMALHLACESLRSGQCEIALAGGVNVISTPNFHISASRAGMLSPTGRCKTFDQQADGFVPGEGIAAVVLKPLSAALRDGDHIWGVVKGSGTNQDGRTNGITAPSGPSQTALEIEVYERFGITPDSITLIEAHGTGTKLGDPIEVDALTDAFRHFTKRTHFCALGSVKANIGHALGAAGIAGVVKVLLCIDQRQIPPAVHFQRANEHVHLNGGPFFIPRELTPWSSPAPRRAAISSFGFSGTNVHVVIEEPPPQLDAATAGGSSYPVTFSAKSEESLRAHLEAFEIWLAGSGSNTRIEDLSYTTLGRRNHFQVRAVLLANTTEDLLGKIRRLLQSEQRMLPETGAPDWLARYLDGADLPVEAMPSAGRTISMPSYCFARERFAPEDAQWSKAAPRATARPTSTTTLLDPVAFPLVDHVVQGRLVLPGVSYLEIARAAGEACSGQVVSGLRNVAWLRPFIAGQSAAAVETRLQGTSFSIRSGDVEHARGQLLFDSADTKPPLLDLNGILGRCDRSLNAEPLYREAARFGLNLGPGLRAIERCRFSKTEVVSELRIPASRTGALAVLDTSILDSSLQSLICLQPENERHLRVPFALAEVKIYSRVPESCVAYGRESKQGFDVSIADRSGRVCVELRGIAARPFGAVNGVEAGPAYFRPVFEPAAGGADYKSASGLKARPTAVYIGSPLADLPVAFRDVCTEEGSASFEAAFNLFKSLALHSPKENLFVLHVCPADDPFQQAVAAMGLTAAREIPRLQFHSVTIHPDLLGDAGFLSSIVEDELGASDGPIFWDAGRKRNRAVWELYRPEPARIQLQAGASYLITGGLGVIGRHTSIFLAERGAKRIALCGRRPLSRDGQNFLAELASHGVQAAYFPADVAVREEAVALIDKVTSQLGPLAGIINAAGVTNDAMLANKTLDQAKAVLGPKVQGVLNLDEATRHLPLDFFVLFSSLAAVLGNVGQADYAYANAFLDHFAEQHRGRISVVNWPVWREGGMSISQQSEQQLARSSGLQPIGTAHAMAALEQALTGNTARFIPIEGDARRFEQVLNRVQPSGNKSMQKPKHAGLRGLDATLLQMAAEALKLSPDRLDPKRHLAEFGMDSITFVELAGQINARFNLDVSPAIFFEHPSINELAAHLAEQMPDSEASPMEREPVDLAPHMAVQAPVRDRGREGVIAIIGMAGVMPGSKNLDEFWEHLKNGDDLISEVPADRWDWREYFGDPSKEANRSNSRWGGFMKEVDKFDARFFGISPREAALMDPQHRIFLEVVWHAIEDAGCRASDLQGSRTGVFVGVGHSDYAELYQRSGLPIEAHCATGTSASMVPNRVSYLLDLHGPSEPVDTACSSSLVALHRAAESIRRGECDMAIAGGVHTMLSPSAYIAFGKAGMLSSDGRCRTFDENAAGYVRGEGAGAVFLKRLDLALADGDPIIALMLGSAVNHGGRASSTTAPNPKAQADLLVQAYTSAGVDPESVGYIETHGTGTKLGDPVEIEGLKAAFRRLSPGGTAEPHCALASVKTNIGHLETAAGIAGVLKVLLAMKNRQLPANVHFDRLNPYIRLDGSPFYIVESARPWESLAGENGRPVLRAGCSSFGFGGANAHVVLEAYDQPRPSVHMDGPALIVLSAKTSEQLRESASQLLDYLERPGSSASLADIACTLMAGREQMEHRFVTVVSTLDQLKETLQAAAGSLENLPQHAWYSDVRTVNTGMSFLRDDEDLSELVEIWTQKGKFEKVAKLWLAGVAIDWRKLPRPAGARRISLPAYPFARDRHWFAAAAPAPARPTTFAVSLGESPSHELQGRPVLAGTVLLDFVYQCEPMEIRRHTWVSPMFLDAPAVVRVEVMRHNGAASRYEVRSGQQLIAHGQLFPMGPDSLVCIPESLQANGETIKLDGWRQIRRSGDEALGVLELDRNVPAGYRRAVAMAEAFHLLAVLPGERDLSAVPHRIERVQFVRDLPATITVYAARKGKQAEIGLLDGAGQLCVSMSGIEFASAPARDAGLLDRMISSLQPSVEETTHLAGTMQPLLAMEPFLPRLLVSALAKLGMFDEHNQGLELAKLAANLGVKPDYHRLFAALLWILEQDGRLQVIDGCVRFNQPPQLATKEELVAERDLIVQLHPSVKPQVRLSWVCLERYPEVLTGAVPAVEVLFPNSEMDLVDPVYRGNPLCDFDNLLAAQTVSRYLRELGASSGQPQIVEIGAGTGGTTADILRALVESGQSPRYVFTDISRSFLRHARTRFGGEYPFVEFETLDIEKDPAAQGFPAGQFDVVVAANVLHATRDIVDTLTNVRKLLKPGGWLVLNEITRMQPFASLTFGLLSGWWLFQDEHRRIPHSPLLDPERWKAALTQAGFARIEVLDGACEAGKTLYQQILVAEADQVRTTFTPQAAVPQTRKAPASVSNDLESVVAELTGQCLGIPLEKLDRGMEFIHLGVDSILGVELVNRLNERLAIDLPKTVLFDYPDIVSLAKYIGAATKPVVASAPPVVADRHATAAAVPLPQPARSTDGIAIIGMAGRFPDAADLDAFWRNLAAGHCSLRSAPPERWGRESQPQWRGGFLSDVDLFDPLFFSMSGEEAELSDPQQRLFLEECWKALEHAGYAPASLAGSRCGVYVGVAKGDYQLRLLREGITDGPSFWGNEDSVLASRISYFLDLRGPSVAVNTACSSSLVAVHLACQSLRSGECSMALAGGVYIGTTPNLHVMAEKAGMLAPDGVCRAFDQDASGMVPGEGVGVVLLKLLADAWRDGDSIYGVIEASGINQDGRTNGITAPSARSQSDLECEVLDRANLDPDTIGYIEAHGTGTKLGDPIEFKALVDTFRRYTSRTHFCGIGSVKTNIGHAITAAGISSLIKVLLALGHRQIPPTLNFRRHNEHLPIEGSPFYINTQLRDWETSGGNPRRAAISSFGFSGTNAHLIVREPDPAQRQTGELSSYVLFFSARGERELSLTLNRFEQWLRNEPQHDLIDVAYTLMAGRNHFRHRLALVVTGIDDLKRQLPGALNRMYTEPRPAVETESAREAMTTWRNALADPARADAGDLQKAITRLAAWYISGATFEPGDLANIPGRRRVGLPTYPFQGKRYWPHETAAVSPAGFVAPSAGVPAANGNGFKPVFNSPTVDAIRRIAAAAFKLEEAELDPAEPFESYGMDSLAAIKFGQKLQEQFGPLPVELTMTCRCINALAAHIDGLSAGTNGHLTDSNGDGPRSTRPAPRSLVELRARGEIEPILAAALISLPVSAVGDGVNREQVRQLFGNQTYWLNALQTSFGNLGIFTIPLFDDELYLDQGNTVRIVSEACDMAGRMGARTVSLTGLIPSATEYARAVTAAAAQRADFPAITTGHAITCSAVVLAIERILAESGRSLENEVVGFLGAGSIGTSVLSLMVRQLQHPREILLCDVFGAQARLQQLSRLLHDELGYRGTVRIAASPEGVAAEIYSASMIVGATNVPNLLEIDKLNPGVLIVDDSAPHCFRTSDAIARFATRNDLLFTEGGLLRLREPVRQFYSVTSEMLATLAPERLELLNWIGREDPNEIMGCMFSALLSTVFPDLEPTVGLIAWRDAERHYAKLKEIGLGSATLHCEAFHLPAAGIEKFRERYGQIAATRSATGGA